ncbi:MAG: GntR family transcriptional regulator [Rhodobacteraceae bacterium]|nr:GntR family transcriptional regulator [Paracoccaceae bacterium]
MNQIAENTDSGRISHRSLHDELVERLREMIMTGTLRAGARVEERELCERFGVSRTPLREALKVLATEGYVTLVPRRGAWVAALSENDLKEAFPIMAALEALAGEMACANATDAEIEHIDRLTHEMAEHHRAGRREAYFELNQKIHLAIAEAARNPTLWRMQRSLDGRVRRGRYQANISSSRWEQAMDEHIRIASALRARDGARTGELLRLHLQNKLRALRASDQEIAPTGGDPTDDP